MTQAYTEYITADRIVDIHIKGYTVFLPPLGLGDDNALVVRVGGARGHCQGHAYP